MSQNAESNRKSIIQFVIALVVVLGGVVLGSIVVLRHEKPSANRVRPGSIARSNMIVSNTNEMVWVPGGTFLMGSPEGQTDERPAHEVMVNGFWMDRTEVTNDQFE